MKNWQRELFVVLAIVGIMLTLQINNALAATEPTGGCEVNGCGPDGLGQFAEADMGWWSPDVNNPGTDVWVWAPDFYGAFNGQLSQANPNWASEWAPHILDGVTYIPIFWGGFSTIDSNCESAPSFCGYNMSIWDGTTPDQSTPICATLDIQSGEPYCQFELNRWPCLEGLPVLGVVPETCDETTNFSIFMACEPCGTGNDGIQFQAINQPEPVLFLGLGTDIYDDNYFDVRTYDATHPSFGMVNSLGGLTVGMDAFGPKADEISRVEIVSVDGIMEQKIVITTPDIYSYGDDTMYAYTMVFGGKIQVAPQYDVFAYDLTGAPIQFQDWDGTFMDRLSIFTDLEQVLPPVMKLRKAVLTKNKGIRVKFTAPFDARNGEIRIRIIDETGIIKQFRDRRLYDNDGNDIGPDVNHPEYLAGLAKDANGHYFFTKNNGTVVLDKIKVFIPMEWAGYNARVEYRTYEGATLRGITFFKLPAPEPVVEEEPEVTVVECPDASGLVSIVNGVCICPDTYNYVDGIGCQ